MASDDLKHLVARDIATGETIAEVARRHGYTWKGMKKLVRTAPMPELIQVERQRLHTLNDQCRARLLQLGPEALDHIGEVLRDPKHPKRLDAARFVIEKILPNRTMLEAEVNLGVSVRRAGDQALIDRTLLEMAARLEEIDKANAGRPDPLSRVRVGSEALRRPQLPDGSQIHGAPGANGFPVVPTEER